MSGWTCVHSRTPWVLPTDSPVRLGVSPTTATPTARGFESLVSHAGILGSVVCLGPQLFFRPYPHVNVGLPGGPATTLPTWYASHHFAVLPRSQLPISAPPTNMDECIFNCLVVGLPYSSIIWQFWLLFVFKLVVILLFVVQGSEAYLPTLPSWLEALIF